MSEDYVNADLRHRELINRAARDRSAAKAAMREAEQRAQLDATQEKWREQARINAKNRRAAWPLRAWPESLKGNETILEDGFRLTVFKSKRGKGWSGSYKQPGSETVKYLRDIHGTRESAKLALFDNMVWLKNRGK